MVFLEFTVPPLMKMPPPIVDEVLPEIVELVTVKLPPLLKMPPPKLDEVLPEIVELVTVKIPPLL
jgi:hypothetical protein